MKYRQRRVLGVFLICAAIGIAIFNQSLTTQTAPTTSRTPTTIDATLPPAPPQFATTVLATIPIKGRAPKTDYRRTQFGDGWTLTDSCDTRNIILNRDLTGPIISDTGCKVMGGTLNDPYTGKIIVFQRGPSSSHTGRTAATNPYTPRATMVWSRVSENHAAIADRDTGSPTTTAASVSTPPMSDASTTFPGRTRYIHSPTSRAIGMVAAMVNVPHELPGITCTLPAGRV